MGKQIVIAGSRKYENYTEAAEFIDVCIDEIKGKSEITILSGGAKGVDLIGEKYAKEHGYKIEKYLPEWNRYGKGAGPKRNEEMAKDCDLVICFWDGKSKGTKSMIECGRKLNKQVKIKLINE